MNIKNIKAALAANASAMNIQPIVSPAPIVETNATTEGAEAKATRQPTPAKRPERPVKTKQQEAAQAAAPSSEKAKAVDLVAFPIESVISSHLKAGIDYNTIPGCGRKPALLKAGAEHLAAIFDLHSTSRIVNRVENYEQGFVLYEVQTTITDKDGMVLAEGLGSCNSKERKYLRTDFATNLNTILKMAKKRSYVDAILTACHASGTFTQDIEDIANEIRMQKEA